MTNANPIIVKKFLIITSNSRLSDDMAVIDIVSWLDFLHEIKVYFDWLQSYSIVCLSSSKICLTILSG